MPVAFELTDFRWGLSTALQCFRLADGGSEACCNAYRTGFRLPCGDDFQHGVRIIEMTPAPTLNLAPTGFGPHRPAALGSNDGGTTTLGCLGCEAGLACSPAEPLRVRAVWGALNGGSFVVDALEME